MNRTPENIVKDQVKRWLRYRGWFSFPIMQGIGSYRGAPDRIAIKGGRVLFIECKALDGDQSLYQKKFQQAIEACGGTYILARSCADLERAVVPKNTETEVKR